MGKRWELCIYSFLLDEALKKHAVCVCVCMCLYIRHTFLSVNMCVCVCSCVTLPPPSRQVMNTKHWKELTVIWMSRQCFHLLWILKKIPNTLIVPLQRKGISYECNEYVIGATLNGLFCIVIKWVAWCAIILCCTKSWIRNCKRGLGNEKNGCDLTNERMVLILRSLWL